MPKLKKKRRINTREKGRKGEIKAANLLIAKGYTVQLAPKPSKFAKQNDMFGLWDLIAVGKEEVRFIQVKVNGYASKEWKKEALAWECPSFCTREIWRFVDRKEGVQVTLLAQ